MVHQLIWIGGSIYKIMNATLKKDIAATGAALCFLCEQSIEHIKVLQVG
jgi:hypothetical protein